MTRVSRSIVTPLLAIAVCATSLPAPAQVVGINHPVTSSVIVTSVVSVVVVTAPVWLVSAGLSKAGDASARRSRAAKDARGKAGPLPPLTVEKVERTPDGGIEMALQNPQAPDEPAVIAWPAREDNPAAAVAVGDVLALTPTQGGAGWTVTTAEGTALAFLPIDAAAAQPSARW